LQASRSIKDLLNVYCYLNCISLDAQYANYISKVGERNSLVLLHIVTLSTKELINRGFRIMFLFVKLEMVPVYARIIKKNTRQR